MSISPFAPTEQLVTGFRPAQQRLVDRILAEDGVVIRTYGQRPIREDRYTLSDGTYYRIDYEQTDTEEVRAQRADLSWEKGQEAPEDEPVVAYTELPAVDQHALEYLVHGPEHSGEGLPTQGLTVRDAPAPYPDGIQDSALVGSGPTWVEWDDRVYTVTITTEEGTVTRRTFEYAATRVAGSNEAFREYVAGRYLRSLDELSSEERTVLDAAIQAGAEGTYEDCNEPSAGYEQLKRRMEDLADLPDPHNDHWYISYGEERYLLEIGAWVA